MILTLTFNPALDRLIFVDEFQPGARMIPHKMVDAVGGKGFDASVALRSLEVDTLALGFVGGDIGRQLVKLLDGYGVAHDLIWVDGETRLSHVIAETKTNRHSHLISGTLPIPPNAYQEILDRYRRHATVAEWIVAAGSLPPGAPKNCYRIVTEIAHKAGRPILLDGVGPPVLAALPAHPTILKMNRPEFNNTFNARADTIDRLQAQAKIIRERENLSALIVTCGKEGLLAATGDGVFLAAAPLQQAVNAAGAGDAASGALAWRLAAGDTWPETLRWTAAISAAAVLTEATAEVRLVDVDRLLPETNVQLL